MITVKTKPQYFKAYYWDGCAARLDNNIEIVVLEAQPNEGGLQIGAIIKDNKHITSVVQGQWIVFNHTAMQIMEGDTFRARFTEYDTIDVEWTTIALLALPQPK